VAGPHECDRHWLGKTGLDAVASDSRIGVAADREDCGWFLGLSELVAGEWVKRSDFSSNDCLDIGEGSGALGMTQGGGEKLRVRQGLAGRN